MCLVDKEMSQQNLALLLPSQCQAWSIVKWMNSTIHDVITKTNSEARSTVLYSPEIYTMQDEIVIWMNSIHWKSFNECLM